MNFSEKVKEKPFICGIEFDFNGSLSPSSKAEFSRFYNSYENNNAFMKAYFSQRSISFTETSEHTNSGTIYNQKLSIQFPSNDLNRSLRIEMLKFVRFIKLKLNTGKEMVLGRNDFYQNAKPVLKTSSNLTITKAEFSTTSIFPMGYVDFDQEKVNITSLLFPYELPLSFANIY